MCTRNRTQPDTSTSTPPGVGFLIAGVFAIAAALMAYLLDHTTPIEIHNGAYGIALSIFIVGAVGWNQRLSEARLRRHITDEVQRQADARAAREQEISAAVLDQVQELTSAVLELADAAAQPRPRLGAPTTGTTYASRAAQDDTIPLAARRIDGDTEPRMRVAQKKRGCPEDEARAQGYAEGYVDGIARRSTEHGSEGAPGT